MPDQLRAGALVGREREIQELLLALAEAEAGHGRLILIAGAPGIGKTRLASELAVLARERGGRVLWGRGWEDAGAPPYWPWIQVLRSLLRQAGDGALRRYLGDDASDVAPMLPDVRTSRTEPTRPSATDPESARFQLFDSAATMLVGAAREVSTLLVIDDAHAADATSLLFLRFLAGQMAESRLLIVVTYRDLELTADHVLTRTVGQLLREPATRTLALGGIAAGAVGDFVAETSGVRPRRQLVAALHRATAGNPLFLGEAVRLLHTSGGIDQVRDVETLQVAVPARIRDAIAGRAAALGPASGATLRSAAALGPEFSLESLRRVVGCTMTEVMDRLDPALQAGLIVAPDAAGRARFAHDLVRETLYAELGRGDRIRLHHQIAQVLEEQFGDTIAAHLGELAYHSFNSLPAGDATKAVAYAAEAGRAAAAGLAFEEAARHFRLALLAMAAVESAMAERCELLLQLGDAEARAGDLADARETFLEAATIAKDRGGGRDLARAALGYGGRFVWARAGADPHVVPLLQAGLAALAGADAALEVRLLARLACAWRSSVEHRADCAALTERALTIARSLDDPATLSYALVGRFWATFWPENPDERLAIARELLAVAEDAGDAERAVDAHWALHVAFSDLGLIAEAKGQLAVVRRAATELRQPVQEWALETYELVLALLEGDYGRAEELVEAERDRLEIDPAHDEVATARIHLFLLRREQGRSVEVEAGIRGAVDEFPWYPYFRAALACLLLDAGRIGEARTVFRDLVRDDARALYRDSEWFLGMSLASEACARLDERSDAATLYAQLLPYAGRPAVAHAEGSLGAVDRYLGLLADALGRPDDAERHLDEAIRLNEGMGARPWVAHAQADLALLLGRRDRPGDQRRATGLADAARETARLLGMANVGAHRAEIPAGILDPRPGAVLAPRTSTFRREGEYWTVSFDGADFRVRDAKGMRYLARLLAEPGRELHALDLARGDGRTDGSLAAQANSHGGDLAAEGFGDAGEVLDAEARRAYRERLAELAGDIDQADAWNDPERALRLRDERSQLIEQLAAAVGLGGRSRVAAAASERARMSVGKAIRSALERIDAQCPPLGRHLAISVHTGTFCSYSPDPGLALRWQL